MSTIESEQKVSEGGLAWLIWVACIFLIGLGFNAYFVSAAISSTRDLVRSDYYQESLKYDTEIKAHKLWKSENWNLEFDVVKNVLQLKILKPDQISNVEKISVNLYKPDNSALDKNSEFQADSIRKFGNQYSLSIPLPKAAYGAWQLEVSVVTARELVKKRISFTNKN